MRTYGQYCPIARASEILAERWTPLVLRNLLHGSTTFTAIAEGAPGMSHSLLTKRLRDLESAGVIETMPNPAGRGFLYRPTAAGRDLAEVMGALGRWGERWIELAPEHLDPGMVLHAWVHWYLVQESLPLQRVVVRFDMRAWRGVGRALWIIFDGARSEVCLTHPGFDEDLVVDADARALAEWHLGRIEWGDALADGRIAVAGSPALARDLPRWNRRSDAAHGPRPTA
jgi:DNA-binding HxlR family transcriptional regulator